VSVRKELHWQSLLPVSLFAFLGWAGLSIFFSIYQWATFWGLLQLALLSLLGLYVALLRDTIQIVRTFGDVLRFVLVVSLALEVFSGLLVDTPLPFLGIEGRMATFGPIQGLLGTRNQFALLAVIALITFATELRTKSITRGLGIGSIALATASLLLTRSPVMFGVALIVALAAGALYGVRRLSPQRRTVWQLALLAAAAVLAALAWTFRSPLIRLFNASGDLDYRLTLWRQVWQIIGLNPVEGWGWIGQWDVSIQPFTALISLPGRVPGSALNAYIDVWLQLGLVGIAIYVGMVALAFVRSWLLAGRRRSIVFAWPALVLGALMLAALSESSVLVGYGWVTFVVCCVKSANELTWRRAFTRPLEQTPLDDRDG